MIAVSASPMFEDIFNTLDQMSADDVLEFREKIKQRYNLIAITIEQWEKMRKEYVPPKGG
jgi:hypothetical protein